MVLLATVAEEYDRIGMHGVRRRLIEPQAASRVLPLKMVFVPKDGSNEEYESRMREALVESLKAGVALVVLRDIFLRDQAVSGRKLGEGG